MTVRERAHQLIDSISADRLAGVVGVLEVLAPAREPEYEYEDELIAEDENMQAAAATGPGIPFEEVLAEYGLTIEGILSKALKQAPAENSAER